MALDPRKLETNTTTPRVPMPKATSTRGHQKPWPSRGAPPVFGSRETACVAVGVGVPPVTVGVGVGV